jgi:hypothetical protein
MFDAFVVLVEGNDECIGKKGATYAACFRDLMNDWGVSHFWASADRCVAA